MLRVLTYHRVREPTETPGLDPSLVSATPAVFERQMVHLARWYNPVSMVRVLEAFHGGRPLPRRAVHVTFDDAYRDFGEVAWPIMRRLQIPATLFVPTVYPERPERYLWWDRMYRAVARPVTAPAAGGSFATNDPTSLHFRADRIRAILRELPHDDVELLVSRWYTVAFSEREEPAERAILNWDELRVLRDEGVALGAHTRQHVALTRVGAQRLREEIRGSLDDLRREVGEAPAVISYPYGMHDDLTVRIAREEGCLLGFTCDDGLSRPGETDPLRIRRTNITPRTTTPLFTLRMMPWFGHVDRWRHRRERERLQA